MGAPSIPTIRGMSRRTAPMLRRTLRRGVDDLAVELHPVAGEAFARSIVLRFT